MNRSEVIIITIGDELLIGQVVDTNSAWIGQQFAALGIKIRRIVSISDDKEAIANEVSKCMAEVDLVLMTGGLGPTKDDITKATLCELFDAKMIFNQRVYDNVEQLLRHRVGSVNHLNKSQAYVPDKAEIFNNNVGTAPIMKFQNAGSTLFAMPGVPFEMKYAVTNYVLPFVQETFASRNFINRTLSAINIAEAVLAERLEEWENRFPDNLSLAYLPSPGLIKLRLTLEVSDGEVDADLLLDRYAQELQQLLGENFLIIGEESPEKILGDILKEKGLSMATAESCTGGYISQKMTSIPGSSAYFKGGIVAYSNDTKVSVLDVDLTSIENFGAVSQQVVEQMAIGASKKMDCDLAVATSGIAGPDGGTKDKPVGTVWIAWYLKGRVQSRMYTFGKLRNVNVERAARMALTELIHLLK